MKQILFLPIFILSIFSGTVFAQGNITLEEIWKGGPLQAKSIYGWVSMKNGQEYCILERKGAYSFVAKYDYKTGNLLDTLLHSRLLKNENGEAISIEAFSFNSSETMALVATNGEKIYRHSEKSNYYLVDLANKKLNALSVEGKQMLADFSPDGSKVAFVRNNNLYYKDLMTGKEIQVSKDGAMNKIINGACDWVYEEEFGFDKAFRWSPDGQRICFYRFDESMVPEFEMTTYGGLYPGKSVFKYPKAGEKNAIVDLQIYDVKTNQLIAVDAGAEKDQYIPRMIWTRQADQVCFIRMNRLQNQAEIMVADAKTGKSRLVFSERSDRYVDINDDWYFLENQNQLLWTSERDGWNHIYLLQLSDGKVLKQLTKGNFEVSKVLGLDEKKQLIYYLSNEAQELGSDLFSVKTDGSDKKRLSSQNGTNDVKFSEGYKWSLHFNSSSSSPMRVSLCEGATKEVRVLEENLMLKEKLKSYNFSTKEFMKIVTPDQIELNAWMIKPPDFDSQKKYPLLFVIYGGPGRNTVLNQWEGSGYYWHQHLAKQGYIVVSVDNRGTARRGAAFRQATYKQLGKLETEDQIGAARYFATLPYVDANRIGIQGWSFGGYLSSLCITKGADIFKVAIAVAPVTNWRYYDSIYTERFLQTPAENATGYDENSPINFCHLLKGKYLLVHGTGDDNVHFQNTVEMISALNKAGKQYDLAVYPDKNHGIAGGNTRLHLYTKMTDFLLKNL
jgi:dipeptidyl-peptidase-4